MRDSTHSPTTFSRINDRANYASWTAKDHERGGTTREPWRPSLTNNAASQRPTRKSGHLRLSCTLPARPDRVCLLHESIEYVHWIFGASSTHGFSVKHTRGVLRVVATRCCLALHRTHSHRRSVRANVAKAFPHNAASLTSDGRPTRDTLERREHKRWRNGTVQTRPSACNPRGNQLQPGHRTDTDQSGRCASSSGEDHGRMTDRSHAHHHVHPSLEGTARVPVRVQAECSREISIRALRRPHRSELPSSL